MSVLIKGMEMPTSCRACMFSRTDIRNTDWCVLTEKDLPCDCPIVPVPDHGRLIDADAAIANRNKPDNWMYDLNDMPEYLEDCPAVIPADKAEEAERGGQH